MKNKEEEKTPPKKKKYVRTFSSSEDESLNLSNSVNSSRLSPAINDRKQIQMNIKLHQDPKIKKLVMRGSSHKTGLGSAPISAQKSFHQAANLDDSQSQMMPESQSLRFGKTKPVQRESAGPIRTQKSHHNDLSYHDQLFKSVSRKKPERGRQDSIAASTNNPFHPSAKHPDRFSNFALSQEGRSSHLLKKLTIKLKDLRNNRQKKGPHNSTISENDGPSGGSSSQGQDHHSAAVKHQDTFATNIKSEFFRNETLTMSELPEMTPIMKVISDTIIISTTAPLYLPWRVLVILLSFFTSFYYPFYAAFWDSMTKDEHNQFDIFDLLISCFFVIDMVLKFLTERRHENNKPERDLGVLTKLYLKGQFMIDVITILPFHLIFAGSFHEDYLRLFLFIKVLRMYQGFYLMDGKVIMRELRDPTKKHTHDRPPEIKKEEKKKKILDLSVEHTKITKMIIFKYAMQVISLILMLISISFLSGMLWLVTISFSRETFRENNFCTVFDLSDQGRPRQVMVLVYFMFTTMSTVGLGDFHPVNISEQIFACFLFLFGVLITSYVMEKFVNMLQRLRQLGRSFEDSNSLSLFMATLKQLNHNEPVSPKFSEEVELYFNYRWAHDRNIGIATDEDEFLLEQLPVGVQHQIFCNFLFYRFLRIFQPSIWLKKDSFLTIENLFKKMKLHLSDRLLRNYILSQVTTHRKNEEYKNFVMSLLRNLEPNQIGEKEVLFQEGSKVGEILFFLNGDVQVGFNDNFASQRLSISHNDGHISLDKLQYQGQIKYMEPYIKPGEVAIGMYEMMFDKPTTYAYRAGMFQEEFNNSKKIQFVTKMIDYYFIRKSNWIRILNMCDETEVEAISGFKIRLLVNYIEKVYLPTKKKIQLTMDYRRAKYSSQMTSFISKHQHRQEKEKQKKRKKPKTRHTEMQVHTSRESSSASRNSNSKQSRRSGGSSGNQKSSARGGWSQNDSSGRSPLLKSITHHKSIGADSKAPKDEDSDENDEYLDDPVAVKLFGLLDCTEEYKELKDNFVQDKMYLEGKEGKQLHPPKLRSFSEDTEEREQKEKERLQSASISTMMTNLENRIEDMIETQQTLIELIDNQSEAIKYLIPFYFKHSRYKLRIKDLEKKIEELNQELSEIRDDTSPSKEQTIEVIHEDDVNEVNPADIKLHIDQEQGSFIKREENARQKQRALEEAALQKRLLEEQELQRRRQIEEDEKLRKKLLAEEAIARSKAAEEVARKQEEEKRRQRERELEDAEILRQARKAEELMKAKEALKKESMKEFQPDHDRKRHHQTFQSTSRPQVRLNIDTDLKSRRDSNAPNAEDVVKQYMENADHDFSMGLSSDKRATRFSMFDPRIDSVHREIIASEKDKQELSSMPFRLPYGSFRQKRNDTLTTSKQEENSPQVIVAQTSINFARDKHESHKEIGAYQSKPDILIQKKKVRQQNTIKSPEKKKGGYSYTRLANAPPSHFSKQSTERKNHQDVISHRNTSIKSPSLKDVVANNTQPESPMEEIKEEIKEDQSQSPSQSQRTTSRQQTISEQHTIREDLPHQKKGTVMVKTETIETLITAEQRTRTNEKTLKTGDRHSGERNQEHLGEKSGGFIMDKPLNQREKSSFNKLKDLSSNASGDASSRSGSARAPSERNLNKGSSSKERRRSHQVPRGSSREGSRRRPSDRFEQQHRSRSHKRHSSRKNY